MFEVVIEKMVDRWSGSIEAGERRAVDSNTDYYCQMRCSESDGHQ
jgi:hypothetical protein